MKNQQSVKLAKSSGKTVACKSAATQSAESGEVVKFEEAGMPQLEVWLESETIWLTQAQLAELFGGKLNTINKGRGTVPVERFCCVLAVFSRDLGSYCDGGGAAEGRGKTVP